MGERRISRRLKSFLRGFVYFVPDSAELMNRVAQLEGEIASLRRVLKRMKGERQDLDDEAAA